MEQAVKDGVLAKVDEPTDWISPGFFVPKPGSGKPRLVTDFSHLNRYVRRPVHPFPSTKEILSSLESGSTWFAKCDALAGYHQIPLDEESSKLTTFLLPSGRYRYLRAPMGLNASSDEWCRRSDAVIEGLPHVNKLVDDILISGTSKAQLLQRVRAVLERCRKAGITISRKKFEIGQRVKFAGHIVTSEGVEPDQEKLDAVNKFPPPTNITELRSFLGLANQLGQFLPDLTHLDSNLRLLLKKKNAFVWLDQHQQDFDKIKKAICSHHVLHIFNPDLPTELLTDASRLKGLGYALMQRTPEGKARLIQCGSRSLLDAESRYATIELEALAILWAVRKCRHYLFGINFHVLTDHRPLLGAFAKPLADLENARLQRFREKLVDYTFDVHWVPGKQHIIADTLSRAPAFEPDPLDESTIINAVNIELAEKIASDPRMQKIIDAAAESEEYQQVVDVFRKRKEFRSLPKSHPAKKLDSVWHELSLIQDCLLVVNNSRIIVPKSLRSEILELLHLPHAGIIKTRKQAQQLYYWPGINRDIRDLIEQCEKCQVTRPRQPREPLLQFSADQPMQQVSADLAECKGQHYLIAVDKYSGFPFCARLTTLSSAAVIKHMRNWFMDFGLPQTVRTDGGPQFRSEFQDFCETWNIKHETSSPYNPDSNGLAEAAVKSVKSLISKSSNFDQFSLALLEWKNTPRADGYSPAQLFFGRRQRTLLPTLPSALDGINQESAQKSRRSTTSTAKQNKDLHAVQHPPLDIGDYVRVQNPITGLWDMCGNVREICDHGRSYIIQFEDNHELRRNRRFLKKIRQAKRGPESTTQNSNNDLEDETDSARNPPAGQEDTAPTKSASSPPPILRRSPRLQGKQPTKSKSVRFRI